MTLSTYHRRHRMPLVFGPTAGPRQGPDGGKFDMSKTPRTTATVSFLTEPEALRGLLPPGCEPVGEPIVTVEHTELRELAWLAGRGYSMLGVKYPARFVGDTEQLNGTFLAVLWENMPEPILSGREEIGWAKIYCELPPPRVFEHQTHYRAVWDGHVFLNMTLEDLSPGDPPPPPSPDHAGLLHHRFLPKVSTKGETEVEQMILTPASAGPQVHYDRVLRGSGKVEFVPSRWEQLPTMFHIVNKLAALPVVEWRGGSLIDSRGASDLSNQRILTSS